MKFSNLALSEWNLDATHELMFQLAILASVTSLRDEEIVSLVARDAQVSSTHPFSSLLIPSFPHFVCRFAIY